jgi:hypothetical protein
MAVQLVVVDWRVALLQEVRTKTQHQFRIEKIVGGDAGVPLEERKGNTVVLAGSSAPVPHGQGGQPDVIYQRGEVQPGFR